MNNLTQKKHSLFTLVLGAWLGVQGHAMAATEALNWDMEDQTNVTCIYGEITVLATIPHLYYCGAQWGGVGGYCGIQHLSPTDRRTIFSMWDTSPTLHPKVTEADPKTEYCRFTGEGEGAHTHMLWDWKLGETFHFFLQKQPQIPRNATETRFYIRDQEGKWRHVSTISSPNGKHNRATSFRDVCSWIENIGGQANPAKPKIALYSLWIGSSPDRLVHLTRSGGESGSGRWGQLHGVYFLAEGSASELSTAFAKLEPHYGKPVFGMDGQELPPIPQKPIPVSVVQELKRLPRAPAVQ